MKELKKGYLLSVTSWENDGDNYNTVILDGLEKEDVDFYLNFIIIFIKLNLENRCDEGITDEEVEQFKNEINKVYGNDIPEKYKDCAVDCYSILSTISDVFSNSEFCTRKYSSHSIYYIPEEIKDISKDFMCVVQDD